MSERIRLSGINRLFLDQLLNVEKFTITERETKLLSLEIGRAHV